MLLAITSFYLMIAGNTAGLSASFFAFAIYALIYRLTKGSLGYGDVRLAPVAIDFHAITPAGSLSIHILAWVFAGFFLLIKKSSSPSLPSLPSVPLAPFLLSATLIINNL
jgi:hypothetical protein